MAWETVLAAVSRSLRAVETLNLSKRIDRVRLSNAIQSLRQIFFYSNELIDVLKDIEEGRDVEKEVVEFYAESFRYVPDYLGEILQYLDRERFESGSFLIIRDVNLLSKIQSGKINVRREICMFFSEYSQANDAQKTEFQAKAERVLGQIERLNSEIQKVETKLLAAHKGKARASL